jgi:ATP-dependent exoDNAse (exonuclease V) beta subunit
MADSTTAFRPVDRDARRRIVETLDRPLVVEAGAGTGKTTLLVSRLLHALEVGAVEMPGIVAISFTEKAAAELRLRLRQALEQRVIALGDDAMVCARMRAALRELHRAQLSTIHAFASSILRERPAESRLDPGFRVLDELESLQLQRTFWRQWVDAELEDPLGAGLLRAVLRSGVQIEPDLHLLARTLYENRDLAAEVPMPPVSPDLSELMQALRRDTEACLRHAQEFCHDAQDKGFVQLREIARRLQVLDDLEPSSWPVVFLQELRIRPQAGRRDHWSPGAAEHNKAMRAELQQQLALLRQSIANGVLGDALRWLRRFLDDYEAEKRRLGMLDFQDLLLHARHLLRDDLAVRREMGRRVRMLCVDEFQDTDPLQAELALFLAEEGAPAPHWQDVRVGPKLFLVGDPKQSIYRFRRADLVVYDRCCDIVRASGGEVLDIRQNFRSRPAVIQWVNGVFEHLFADAGGSTPQARHVPLAALPERGGGPAVWIVEPSPAEVAEPETWRQREAQALVRLVQRALSEGWRVNAAEGRRTLRPGDIAFLFARTPGVELYEDALRAAGLPFRQEGGKLFFQRQEVRDVLQALSAIDDPQDELALVAALRSPLFGATDTELWLHRARHGRFDYLSPARGSPLEEALQLFGELHAQRHEQGVAASATLLLARTGARSVYAARPHGERALANFDLLLHHARRFAEGRALDLREFVRALRELEDDPPRLAEWSPEEEGSEQVRLLTVHMAKGLEFPFILLANLASRGHPQQAPLVYDRASGRVEVRLRASDVRAHLSTAGFDAVAELEREREVAEERRLLYVAATRARDYLALGAFHGSRVEGLLKPLREVPGALGESAMPGLGLAGRPGRETPDDSTRWCVIASDELESGTPPQRSRARHGDVERLLAARSAWEIDDARRRRRAAEESTLLSTDVGLHDPRCGSTDTERVDLVTHAVLAQIPLDIESTEMESRATELAERMGARPDVVVPLVMQAHSGEIRARVAAAKRVRRGVRLSARIGFHLVETTLDLVLEEADGLRLIDFTTREEGEAMQRSLVLRALALAAAGAAPLEAGTFFLRSGHYLPVDALKERMQRLRSELEGVHS